MSQSVDYDKQFQDDLAKATALSLEQQALDDYRRSKKYGTPLHANSYERSNSQQQQSEYYAQLCSRHLARSSSRDSRPAGIAQTTPHLAAPPPVAHRRHSEVAHSAAEVRTAVSQQERSRTPPPPPSTMLAESDLISFSSPTQKNAESSSFQKLIEDLQQLQTTNAQSALVPFGPTAAAPIQHAAGFRAPPQTAAYATPQFMPGTPAAAGLQLVPFTPPPAAAQQKTPLTNEELKKLYSLSQSQVAAGYHHPMGFMPPTANVAALNMGFYAPQYNAAYAPQYAPNNMYAFPQQQQQQQTQHFHNPMPSYIPTPPTTTPTAQMPNSSNNANIAANAISNSNKALVKQQSLQFDTASGVASGSSSSMQRQKMSPARKQRTGDDLIDLNLDDDSRVSVLEAFDPLLNETYAVWKK